MCLFSLVGFQTPSVKKKKKIGGGEGKIERLVNRMFCSCCSRLKWSRSWQAGAIGRHSASVSTPVAQGGQGTRRPGWPVPTVRPLLLWSEGG